MSIREEWVSPPNTPGRLVEAMARAVFVVVVYVAVLVAVVVVAGATVEWFASLGLLGPLAWLLEWAVPSAAGSR